MDKTTSILVLWPLAFQFNAIGEYRCFFLSTRGLEARILWFGIENPKDKWIAWMRNTLVRSQEYCGLASPLLELGVGMENMSQYYYNKIYKYSRLTDLGPEQRRGGGRYMYGHILRYFFVSRHIGPSLCPSRRIRGLAMGGSRSTRL